MSHKCFSLVLKSRILVRGNLGFLHASNFLAPVEAGRPRLFSDEGLPKKVEGTAATNDPAKTGSDENIHRAPSYKHKPTNFEKRMLVWSKKYASIEEVPEYVSRETMDKAKNKTRIYTNIIMGGVTLVACIAMVISGKRAAKRGESVQQQNLDWHKSSKDQK